MPVPTEWLEKINREFEEAGIAPHQRPCEALRRYSLEFKAKFLLSSPIAEQVFAWFRVRSKRGGHDIGPLYESVYYFDGSFWKVSIPVEYGRQQLDVLACLPNMPESLKHEMYSTAQDAWRYAAYWGDCVDYGMGIAELMEDRSLDPFGRELLLAAHQELKAAVSQLKEVRPDSRAVLACRMATEIFLKAYIALKAGLTDTQAKREIGHDLQKAFSRFVEVSEHAELAHLRSSLDVFPPVKDRYTEQSLPMSRVWEGFLLAQSIGTVIAREWTGRNTLAQVVHSNNNTGR